MSRYTNMLQNIHAPQEQIDLALDNVYLPRLEEIHPHRTWKAKAISGMAAALAVAVGITAISITGGRQVGFTVTANAAEITDSDFVTLGTLTQTGGGSGVEWDEQRHILSLTYDKGFCFAIQCAGSGIKTVSYSVSDGAYFGLVPGESGITDTVPYSHTHSLEDENYSELVTSYTVDDAADVTPELIFTAEEFEGKYCKMVEELNVLEPDEKGMTVLKNHSWEEDVCCDMFNEYIDPVLTVTATYDDGRTATRRVGFAFEKGVIMGRDYNETESTPHTVVEVKAKLL